MPKQSKFDFDVVRLPYGETIIKPYFKKKRKLLSVNWNGKKVTEAKVVGVKRVECNGVPTPIQDLTRGHLINIFLRGS